MKGLVTLMDAATEKQNDVSTDLGNLMRSAEREMAESLSKVSLRSRSASTEARTEVTQSN